ncbi:MAG: hypothetical protein ACM3PP_03135 [Candidatus Saccharibacteria bacterium]
MTESSSQNNLLKRAGNGGSPVQVFDEGASELREESHQVSKTRTF